MTALYKILPMAIMQSAMLAGGQVFLKLAMVRMKPFAWTWSFFGSLLTNWPFAACGLCFLFASLLWMHMLKVFPLSLAYPLSSLSFVFGMVVAIVFFHEEVPLAKWIGVGLIVGGCCLIAK